VPPYRISEAETRYSIIDPQLKKAGWNVGDRTQVGIEIPVSGYDTSSRDGFTDYCLYRPNGDILAVVEAKRTSRDARVGKQQVLEYITKIEKKQSFRPFAFLANGDDVFFWDSEQYAERHVAGFFSRDNLERLLFLKQQRKPLDSVKINSSIIDRSYQIEAVRRISETIEKKKKRKALLIMATGTGKTRTIMGLIDVFLRAHAAQKVLFLADRDALVEQALTDGFKQHLPDESRTRIRTYAIDKTARVFVSTLQTLELCYDKFTPGDFDLIFSDECHRSIYNKFTDVLAYFDAIQIGLTATPSELVDRDTFRFFDCEGKTPTFLYTYKQAVDEEYLAPYSAYSAQTKFQRTGIKGVDLTEEERESLRRQGLDPDDINFEGTDLERKVTNKDTLRRQWEEFMEVCIKDASGQLPGKSIVFAITQEHAMRLAEVFNEMYPEYGGALVQVITSKMERTRTLIDNFKKEDMPRIAISVDMLDTGIDVPEVVNLAFMKPVNSKIKFWQMIGRGTRHHKACKKYHLLPDHTKEYFLIVDFWQNFKHFNMKMNEDEGKSQVPVLVTIFNTRLTKLELLLGDQSSDDFKRVVKDLRADVSRIPLKSFSVKKVFKEVKDAWEDDFWRYITAEKIQFLRMKVGPLLRFVPKVNHDIAFFTSKMERCGLAIMQHRDLGQHIQSIREDVDLLPTNLDKVAQQRETIDDAFSNDFWLGITVEKLDRTKDALAPLMRYKRERKPEIVSLELDDIIESKKWVILKKDSQRLYVQEYRKRIEERIMQLADRHPTLKRLKTGEVIDTEDLIRLEETLEAELGSDEIDLDEENMLRAYGIRVGSFVDFLKHVLQIETIPSYEDIVRKAFDAFILEHNYNADQSRFLRAVQSVFINRRKLDIADLYEEPFTRFGQNAVEKLFSEEEIRELLKLTNMLAA
jgi:type I restriction enzyme, R subunit